MRRAAQFCGFAGSFALAVLVLVCAGHTSLAVPAAAGMSAPPPVSALLDSTPGITLPAPHFDGHALPSSGGDPARVTVGRADQPASRSTGRRLTYGPLHRRPPPDLS